MRSSRRAQFAWLLTVLGSVACRAAQTAPPMPALALRLTVLASAPGGALLPATTSVAAMPATAELDLAAFRGQVVWITFFAADC